MDIQLTSEQYEALGRKLVQSITYEEMPNDSELKRQKYTSLRGVYMHACRYHTDTRTEHLELPQKALNDLLRQLHEYLFIQCSDCGERVLRNPDAQLDIKKVFGYESKMDNSRIAVHFCEACTLKNFQQHIKEEYE